MTPSNSSNAQVPSPRACKSLPPQGEGYPWGSAPPFALTPTPSFPEGGNLPLCPTVRPEPLPVVPAKAGTSPSAPTVRRPA